MTARENRKRQYHTFRVPPRHFRESGNPEGRGRGDSQPSQLSEIMLESETTNPISPLFHPVIPALKNVIPVKTGTGIKRGGDAGDLQSIQLPEIMLESETTNPLSLDGRGLG